MIREKNLFKEFFSKGGSLVIPLFTERFYTLNAVVIEHCKIIRLSKKNYLDLKVMKNIEKKELLKMQNRKIFY